ncbi:hypothetical protein K3495_g12143 [Podosphaera aphanis]|nr:hypothetical protein K3495_g12143 [Podosphaera aphanis]
MRPSKHIKFPPPLYLSSPGTRIPYCHTCGRVNSPRRSHQSADPSTPVKFCSDRCRRSKPGPLDLQIEDAFVALLENQMEQYVSKYGEPEGHGFDRNKLKLDRLRADRRIKHHHRQPKSIVFCSEVEAMVFWQRFHRETSSASGVAPGNHQEQDRIADRETTQASLAWECEDDKNLSIKCEIDPDCSDMLETRDYETDYITDAEEKSIPSTGRNHETMAVAKSSVDKIDETDDLILKQRQGQRLAEEREMVRRAARRGVAFGFKIPDPEDSKADAGHLKKNRKRQGKDHSNDQERQIGTETPKNIKMCEAVVVATKSAVVVEASFAKGDWGVRWRKKD